MRFYSGGIRVRSYAMTHEHRMPWNHPLSVLLSFATTMSVAWAAPALRPIELRCEYAANPLGIDIPNPQPSWLLEGDAHDQRQTACQIRVATTAERLAADQADQADLWDSGRIDSSQSVHVAYGGIPLTSRQRCHWKVRVWEAESVPSDWSAPATWEMGLLQPQDWQATWIGSGPGYYELQLNGPRVWDQVLAPAKTNYRQWVLYDVHDVTPLVRFGTNVLGVTLGNGWYNPNPKWWQPYRMQWFGSKRLLLQLHLTYVDGSEAVIVSDDTWKTAPGPVLDSCVYDGEIHDATQEQAGWPFPEFDDSGWQPANRVEPPGGRLMAQLMPPIRITETIRPVALTQPRP
jgi:alpha-L-rhamnosidase